MKLWAVIVALFTSLFITKAPPVATPSPTTEPVVVNASPTPTPTLKPTIKPSPKPVVVSHKPVATPSGPDCSGYDKSAPSASVKVSFTSGSNSMKVVQIHSKPGCNAVNNGANEGQDKAVFAQNGETTFGNLYPGSYTVDVKYGTGLTPSSTQNINVSAGQTGTVTIQVP